MMILLASAIAGIAVLIALARLLRKAVATHCDQPVTVEWIHELSAERYRPMMRLLDGGELAFLRSQPGFTPEAARKLRVQRCQIFEGYLKSLSAEFERVCGAIKLLMMQAAQDRPDLAAGLLRHQVLFACGLVVVQTRLFLYRFGWCGVDVANLVRLFDSMRVELRTLAPASSAMSA